MNNVGRRITHKLFGSGLIVSQTEVDIIVRFESKKEPVAFKFPDDTYQNFFEFDSEYDKKRDDFFKVLTEHINGNSNKHITRTELIDFASTKFPEENLRTVIEITRGIFKDLTAVLNVIPGNKYLVKGETIYENEEEASFAQQVNIGILTSYLSYYIIYKNLSQISKDELYQLALKNYFIPNNVKPQPLSKKLMRKIVSKLNANTNNIYGRTDNSIYLISEINPGKDIENNTSVKEESISTTEKKPSEEENKIHEQELSLQKIIEEIVSMLSEYISKNQFDEITRGDLFTYSLEKYFKPNDIQTIEISISILESIINEMSKKYHKKYLLENKTLYREIYYQKLQKEKKQEEIKQKPKLLTKPGMVSELIKTIILTDAKQRQFYTANDIKEYFLTQFNQDPGNLITRKLLINVCIELYQEEKKYCFVDGDGNSLQLWRAKNIQEWQYFGLGTVYNPVVTVNNKTFNINDFVLHVYESVSSVPCGKSSLHLTESVTINTITITGSPVSFNAYYCSKCNKYFTTKATIDDIFPQKNYPFVKLKLLYTEGAKLQSETILHFFGYTVNANGPTEIQRENLLAKLLTYGVVTKKEVEGLLWHLIHYNGRKKNNENAKAKWESDLEFVRDFNLSKQKQINAKRVIFR